MKISRILFLLFITITIWGCKHYGLPRGFPKVNKMADILVELQIAEALITQEYNYSKTNYEEVPKYYKYILEKHGYTAQQFDSIRKWYAHHPDLYVEVHKKTISKISREEAIIKARIEEEKRIEKLENEELEKLRQLKNLWNDSLTINLSPTDTIDKFLDFNINVDTLNLAGEIEFSAKYKFLKEDMSKNPEIMIITSYKDSISDTITKKIPHSFNQREHKVTINLRDTIYPDSIHGYLLLQDSTEQVNVTIEDIFLENIENSFKKQPKEIEFKEREIIKIE